MQEDRMTLAGTEWSSFYSARVYYVLQPISFSLILRLIGWQRIDPGKVAQHQACALHTGRVYSKFKPILDRMVAPIPAGEALWGDSGTNR